MSIANKLTYLNDTKTEIKNAINYEFENVLDDTTFREYADKIMQLQENYKQYIPYSTVEGTSFNIKNAIPMSAKDFVIYGKIKQETRSGKNMLDYIIKLQANYHGLKSVVNDDGSITTTGKPTGNYVQIFSSMPIDDILENGQTYTISQTFINLKLYLQINAENKLTGEIVYYGLNSETFNSKSFTVDKEQYEYRINIQTNTLSIWGDEELTFTNFYQLEKGDTATDFEKYGVSPSPEFPSEIKTLKLKNAYILQSGSESKENKYLIETSEDVELCSINDIADEWDLKNSKLIKRITKYIFDGSSKDTYAFNNDLTNCLAINLNPNGKGETGKKFRNKEINMYCDKFLYKGNINDFEHIYLTDSKTTNPDYIISNIRLYLNKSRLPDYQPSLTNAQKIDLVVNWLKENPITVYYIYINEQEKNIEPINVKLFEGTNNIELKSNIETNMKLEYYKDYRKETWG